MQSTMRLVTLRITKLLVVYTSIDNSKVRTFTVFSIVWSYDKMIERYFCWKSQNIHILSIYWKLVLWKTALEPNQTFHREIYFNDVLYHGYSYSWPPWLLEGKNALVSTHFNSMFESSHCAVPHFEFQNQGRRSWFQLRNNLLQSK